MTGHNGRHNWRWLSVVTDTARTLYAAFPPTLKAAEAPPPPKLVARQTPEQRQQCFDARVAEFVRAGMTHEEAAAAATKEGW